MRDDLQLSPQAGREPLLNVPWTLIVLVGALVATHAARVLLGIPADSFALTAEDLDRGRFAPLVSHLFVHADWVHLSMNSAFTLAFGAPVARLLGSGLRGAVVFLVFFILCGVLAALSYAGVASLLPPCPHPLPSRRRRRRASTCRSSAARRVRERRDLVRVRGARGAYPMRMQRSMNWSMLTSSPSST